MILVAHARDGNSKCSPANAVKLPVDEDIRSKFVVGSQAIGNPLSAKVNYLYEFSILLKRLGRLPFGRTKTGLQWTKNLTHSLLRIANMYFRSKAVIVGNDVVNSKLSIEPTT